jgi:hypothetical protein
MLHWLSWLRHSTPVDYLISHAKSISYVVFALFSVMSPGSDGHAVLCACAHSGEPQGTGRYEADAAGSKGADKVGQPA